MKTTNKKYFMKSGVVIFLICALVGCTPEIDEKYITTFTGDMVYSYLKKDTANYSEFVKYIDKAGLKGMLSAYGTYTCLAPTNDAFKAYYTSKGGISFESLTNLQVEYIAKTHIFGQKYLTRELSPGAFPSNNMNDRVVDLKFDTIGGFKIVLNDSSVVLESDIEVYNGVIQKINRILTPATAQLSEFIAKDSNLKIFTSALKLTGLADSLLPIEDYSYIKGRVFKDEYSKIDIVSPPARKYGFTALAETDDVYLSNGIHNLEDLIIKAKEWYPGDAEYDNVYTDRNNSLNKFISYHLVEKRINTNQFYYSQHAALNVALYEYIETMYKNRLIKSSNEQLKPGMAALLNSNTENKIYVTNTSKSTINGVYHYLSDILLYTASVEDMIRNSRIRFDVDALLPEMMNNELRQAAAPVSTSNGISTVRYGIPPGYFKYLSVSSDTRLIYLGGDASWNNYQGDEMSGIGNYDITVRLMPVPPGTYELRFAYTANANRSVTQIYVDGKPVGIPLDLKIHADHPKIGWLLDSETDDNGVENDKTMRNRGYLKGPIVYGYYSNGNLTVARNGRGALRRIIGIYTFDTYEPHYVRFKSVIDMKNAMCMMDYFEYVPKSIYAPPGGTPETRD